MVNIARKTSTLQYRQSIDCHNCGATNNIEEPWKKLDSEQRRTSAEGGCAVRWVPVHRRVRGRQKGRDAALRHLLNVAAVAA